jgi:acetyltransferase-like isoleucine patch superfamily enzyme
MNAEQQFQHDCLVNMLYEQESLYAAPVVYEPVIRTKPEMIHLGDGSRIDSFCKLEGGEGLRIGRYVHIASFVHLNIGGGYLEIGDYAAVASGGRVISGSNQVSALSMSACAPQDVQRVVKSRTTLQQFAVVLAGATVLPGITLHEGAVLSAGAVATKDIPAWQIWAGVPARFLRWRLLDGKCPIHRDGNGDPMKCTACMEVEARR